MGWASRAYGERRGAYRIFFGERDHLEDPSIVGRIILKLIFKKWDGSIDWIDVV